MNTYIKQTKDIILDYLGKAQRTEAKIQQGRGIYVPDAMEKEEARLRGELLKERKEAEARINAIYQEASKKAREWGNLDGAKLTADAQLLKGEGVTPEQFNMLVDRYQDNYTMLDQLRKYGEARNAEAVKHDLESGHSMTSGPYAVHNIPGPDDKRKEWDAMLQQAEYFLNVADGTGFKSDFERSFAKGAADKQFEAWGNEETAPDTSKDAVQAFKDAWGFTA